MAPHLFTIDKAPARLPSWDAVIEDLGRPHAHRVARVLGVGRSTVYRWNAEGSGPRVAVLALFWLTRWGRSLVDTQATNDAVLYSQLAGALEREREQLQRQVNQLDAECRQLAYDAATARLSGACRDSAATAGDCRTDTAPAGLPLAAASSPLTFPELAPDLLEQLQAAQRVAGAAEHPGIREAPPRAAHSGKSPAAGSSSLPPPSGPQVVAQSSPCSALWCQSDAILASHAEHGLRDLLELGQARTAAPATDAAARLSGPPAAAPSAACTAGHSGPASHDAQRRPVDEMRPDPQGRPCHADIRCAAGCEVARSGTPPSAARPERPASLGRAPDPPPRAATAQPTPSTRNPAR